MTSAAAAVYDVSSFAAREVSFAGPRRVIRRIVSSAILGLGAVVFVGLAIAAVTFAAAWLVNASVSGNPRLQARTAVGPGTLALIPRAPAMADASGLTFADKWARATATMRVAAVPLATPHTQVAQLVPAAAPPAITPLPPKRPTEMANLVPLPRSYPGQREIVTASIDKIAAQPPPQLAPKLAPVAPPPAEKSAARHEAPAEKRVASREAPTKSPLLPGHDSRTAIYDISAHTVFLPGGERLEAHSGLGDKMDDPRFTKVRMRGPTPPNVYDLTLREELFHGVRAIRLNPVDEDKMFGRAGMLAHTYMLGPNGQSNGCVSFKDYDKFLRAFLRGKVDRMVVVTHLDEMPSRVAYERRGKAERFASNN
jgi:Tlde1 domain